MQTSLSRALAALLAVVGLGSVLVWLTDAGTVLDEPYRNASDLAGFASSVIEEGAPAWRATRRFVAGQLALLTLLSGWIGIALVRSRASGEAMRALMLSVASICAFTGFFFFFAAYDPHRLYSSVPFGLKLVLETGVGATFGLAAGMMIRFAAFFPRRLTGADVDAYVAAAETRRVSSRFLPARLAAALERRRVAKRSAARDARSATRMLRLAQHPLLPPMLSLLTAAAVGYGASSGGPDGTGEFGAAFATFQMLLMGAAIAVYVLLRLGQASADPPSRAHFEWIFGGASIAWIMVVVLGGGAFVLGMFFGGIGYYVYLVGLIVVLPTLAILSLIAGIAMAVFYTGAIDPGLVVKRTYLYSLVGILLTIAFVAIEGAVSSTLLSRVGLPGGTSAVIAGSVIALMFGPMRTLLEGRTTRLVDRVLGAPAHGMAVRRHAVLVLTELDGHASMLRDHQRDAIALASLLHTTAQNIAERHDGRLARTTGGEVLAEFPVAERALTYARQLHLRFPAAARAIDLPEPALRSGVHAGEVTIDAKGEVAGEAADVARRVRDAAGPSEIRLSDAIEEPDR